ncbi:MAG TPA: VCBS domain-containing protein, partial [Terriglobales bacterium]|nr:VCBS domain-containing protein [Terriglobales bacterium]
MGTTTTNGTTTSFGNTPQAGDDSFYGLVTEDSTSVVYLNVMANDLGGNAKTLYSVDNGTTVNTNATATDLLVKDVVYGSSTTDPTAAIASTNDTSLNGAKIWITADGKVAYDPATWSSTFYAQVQALPAGQTLTDTFIYAIKLGNGTLSWATATVYISGLNDAATITGVSCNSVTEAGGIANGIPGIPTTGGTVTVHDVDAGQNHFQTVTPASLVGSYGTFTFDANSGVWTYTLDQSKSDSLTAGQVAHDTLTVTSLDGTVSQVIDVKITGSNDNATITTSVSEDTSVVEAGGVGNATPGDAHAGGTLTVHDVDNGENHFQAVAPASLVGTYGTFTFDSTTGVWTYTLDQSKADPLTAGQHVTDTLTVYSADGTASQTITVNITGSNDSASITASASEDTCVVEAGGVANGTAGDPHAGGTLTVHDVDSGENHFQTPASLVGSYGTFTFDPSTGVWGYTLDQSKADPLTDSQHVTDTLTVYSADGAASQTITVNITGSNDSASITASASEDTCVVEAGGVANGSAGDPHAGGTLTVHDVDSGENHFQAVAPASLVGSYGNFTFDSTTGVWAYTLDQSKADPLTAGQHVTDTLTVYSADGTANQTITVNITGSNDAPVITSGASAATPENVSTSTAVYTVAATDVDSGAVVHYSLSGTDSKWFNIDDTTGAVTFKSSPDYEAPADNDGNNVYDIVVHANDGIADTTKAVAITVTNVSETPTTTIGNIDISADSGSSDSDFITNIASQTITATLSHVLVPGESLLGSVDGGTTWIDITSKVSGTAITWDGATLAGSSSIEFQVTNTDGNHGPVATQSYVLDTTADAGSDLAVAINDG